MSDWEAATVEVWVAAAVEECPAVLPSVPVQTYFGMALDMYRDAEACVRGWLPDGACKG